MRVIALFLFLLLPPSYAGQVFSSLEAVDKKNTTLISNAAGSDEKIIKTVTASGYGTSIESAAQNAAENALIQVVGSFIDAETQIKKQKEIRDGVISKTKVIKKDIRDYSQGSIKYFEILNVQENGSIFNLTARVDVRVEDFRAYIKELAYERKKIKDVGMFSSITTEVKNDNEKANILIDKIFNPIASGEVIDIEIGKPQRLQDFYLPNVQVYTDYATSKSECRFFSDVNREIKCGSNHIADVKEFNLQTSLVIPFKLKLRKQFRNNIENILENISTNKISIGHIEYNRLSINAPNKSKGLLFQNFEKDYDINIGKTDYNNISLYHLKNIKQGLSQELDNNHPLRKIDGYGFLDEYAYSTYYKKLYFNRFKITLIDNNKSQIQANRSRVYRLNIGDPTYSNFNIINPSLLDLLIQPERTYFYVFEMNVDNLQRIKDIEMKYVQY
tara:strand:+ start:1745 stop:3079 length:1335 start_codon:yes stop_codon:yes gene_type:complete